MKIIRIAARTWAGRPLIDTAVAIGTWTLFYLVIGQTPPGTATGRQLFLQTFVGISVGAIAFAITGTSILLAVTLGTRLQSLMRKAGYHVTRLIMTSVAILLATSFGLSAIIVYESRSPSPALIATEATLTMLSVLAQVRLVWLFSQIFALLALERT
jgi:hypothetical protein